MSSVPTRTTLTTFLLNPLVWLGASVIIGIIFVVRSKLFKDLENTLDQFARTLTTLLKTIEDVLNKLDNPVMIYVLLGLTILLGVLGGLAFIWKKFRAGQNGKDSVSNKEELREKKESVNEADKEAGKEETFDDADLDRTYDPDSAQGRETIAENASKAYQAQEAIDSGKLASGEIQAVETAQANTNATMADAIAVSPDDPNAEQTLDDADTALDEEDTANADAVDSVAK